MSGDMNNQKAEIWDAMESSFAAHAAGMHVPMFGTFELTPRCNLHCKMCYIRMSSQEVAATGDGELSTKQWLRLAEEAIKNETLYLLLTGGEPLLREDFTEIYTEISKMGFMVFLNTNATLMNGKYFDLFSKYPPTATSVTLYGADAGTYRNICGNADDFDRTIRGLEYLADTPTLLEVRTTFIKDNKDQLERLREIANRYSKRYAINYHVFKPVQGVVSSAERCRLSAKEAYDIRISNEKWYSEKAAKERSEKAQDLSFDTEQPDVSKPKDVGVGIFPEILSCLAAKAMYWIRWDGKMLPCGTFSYPYTMPLEEGFKTAWDRLPGLLSDLKHPQKCIDCEFYDGCPNCPAYFQAETGSFDEVPDYICSHAKERHARYIKESSTQG